MRNIGDLRGISSVICLNNFQVFDAFLGILMTLWMIVKKEDVPPIHDG